MPREPEAPMSQEIEGALREALGAAFDAGGRRMTKVARIIARNGAIRAGLDRVGRAPATDGKQRADAA